MKTSTLFKAFFVLPAMFACTLATAQDESEEADGLGVLEEVLVTATRRGETDLQTTPVTISLVTGEDFSKLFAADVGEIATYVPGFSAATVTGFNAASFAMRGGGEADIIVYFDPKVAVLVDDFVIPHVQTQLLEPFDIETVEVLRGPQGTLFGKNTTAGAVVVRTKRPDLEKGYAEGTFRYGSLDHKEGKLAINIPISDTLGFRASGIYMQNDGYYKNGKVSGPLFDAAGGNTLASGDALAAINSGELIVGDGRELGGKKVFSGRVKLLWEPNQQFSALLQYEIIRDDSEAVPVINETLPGSGLFELLGFYGISGGDPLDQAGIGDRPEVGFANGQQIDVDGVYANIEWDISDNYTFNGNVGYRYQESRLPNEYAGETYNSVFTATRDDDRSTLQVEGRISSNFSGPFNYLLGGFFQENDVEFCVYQFIGFVEFVGAAVPGLVDNNSPVLLCNNQDATSYAFFGDMTYDINDKLQIGGGVRWTHEKKDFIGRPRVPLIFIDPTLTVANLGEPIQYADFDAYPALAATDSTTWEEPTWRATVSYQFMDDIFGYFTASRGFKSGSYNDQAGSSGGLPLVAYDPEFVDNYEVGVKMDLLNNRLRLNVVYFNASYEDFQRTTVVTVGLFQETTTFNAASVSTQGIEAEGTFVISDNLTLRANIGWLDASYDEFLLDLDADGTPDLDLSDRPLTRAPKITAGVDLTYYQKLQNRGNIRYNFNFNYVDKNNYYYNELDSAFDTVLEERSIVNLSASWTDESEKYTVSVFGKNLTDDRYKTASQAVAGLWTFSNYGPPRTYGVEVGVKFDF